MELMVYKNYVLTKASSSNTIPKNEKWTTIAKTHCCIPGLIYDRKHHTTLTHCSELVLLISSRKLCFLVLCEFTYVKHTVLSQ